MSKPCAVITLRLPFHFHKRLKELAEQDNRSLNRYILRKLGYDEKENYHFNTAEDKQAYFQFEENKQVAAAGLAKESGKGIRQVSEDGAWPEERAEEK